MSEIVLPNDVPRIPKLGDIVMVRGPEAVILRPAVVTYEPEPDTPGRHRLDLFIVGPNPRIEARVPPATEVDGGGWSWRHQDIFPSSELNVYTYARHFMARTTVMGLLNDMAVELAGGPIDEDTVRPLLLRYEEVVGAENVPTVVGSALEAERPANQDEEKQVARFNVDGFNGVVQTKQFNIMPDGKNYIGVAGKVSVLQDKDLIGFEVSGGETANWLLRVDGPNGSVSILGCQVRMVHQFDGGIPSDLDSEFYRVP